MFLKFTLSRKPKVDIVINTRHISALSILEREDVCLTQITTTNGQYYKVCESYFAIVERLNATEV